MSRTAHELLDDVRASAVDLAFDAFAELGGRVDRALPRPLDSMFLLPFATCRAAGGDDSRVDRIAAALALQALGYRLLDDLADGDHPAPFARGAVVHVAGALQMVCTRALLTAELGRPELQRLVSRYLQSGLRVYEGQHRDAAPVPTGAGYRDLVELKTVEAFRFLAAAGAVAAGAPPDAQERCEAAGRRVGWMVQILDDLESFFLGEVSELARGRRLLPIWVALESDDDGEIAGLLAEGAEAELRRRLVERDVPAALMRRALDARDEARAALGAPLAPEGVALLDVWLDWTFRDAERLLAAGG